MCGGGEESVTTNCAKMYKKFNEVFCFTATGNRSLGALRPPTMKTKTRTERN